MDNGVEDGRVDRTSASQVARGAGVGTMIIGEIGSLGSRIIATTELVDVASGRSLGQAQAQGEGPEDVFALAENLSSQLRDLLGAPLDQAEAQALEQQLTSSVDAYRAYVRAEELMERNVFLGAQAAFKEATELDPAFALAWFWQGIVLGWSTGNLNEDQADCFRRAEAFRERLPEEIARVMDAALVQVEEGWANSVPLLEEIVKDDPDQLPAHYLIGEAFLHSSVVNDADRAVYHFGRVLELDPGFSLIYEHYTSACIVAGDFERARARFAEWEESQPQIVAPLKAWVDSWEGRFEGLKEHQGSSVGQQLSFSTLSRIMTEDWEGWDEKIDWDRLYEIAEAKDYEALMEEVRASEDWQFNTLAYWRAPFELVIGIGMLNWSPDEAFSESERAEFDETDSGAFILGTSRHRFARIHSLLGETESARKITEGVLVRFPRAPRALYIAAKFAARDGDVTRARALHERLEAILPEVSPTAQQYLSAIAAELALAEGDATEARRLYEEVLRAGGLIADAYAVNSTAGPAWREGLARACAAQGDLEATAGAWRGLVYSGQERGTIPILWISSLYELGAVELELGRLEEGRGHLEHFLSYWGEVNPDLPMVQSAMSLLGQ